MSQQNPYHSPTLTSCSWVDPPKAISIANNSDGLRERMFFDTIKKTAPLPPINLFKKDYKPACSVTECLREGLGLFNLEETIEWCQDRANEVMSSILDDNDDNENDLPKGANFEDVYSILMYTYKSGVSDINETVYYKLNKVLRDRGGKELVEWRDYLYYLMTALNKLPSQGPIRVYRGINFKVDTRKNYKVKNKISWNGLTSTSVNREMAEKFAEGKSGTLFVIDIGQTGKAVHNMSVFPDEEEIILEPNSEFIVTGSTDSDMGCSMVYLQQIPARYPILVNYCVRKTHEVSSTR
eukprot:TRINITY_DN3974_c0_g1_i1.p1 TRINITY_DN3974_c0_g1~~TRINITY_DN3974_c0_g1_i1.p1  ORF type:complete len:304 (+),score=39.47 TRINITY_DN3974_c0_g1_i1:26-913(+)